MADECRQTANVWRPNSTQFQTKTSLNPSLNPPLFTDSNLRQTSLLNVTEWMIDCRCEAALGIQRTAFSRACFYFVKVQKVPSPLMNCVYSEPPDAVKYSASSL